MVELTKISTKGQVVIPQELREKLELEAGDTLQIEEVDGLLVLKKVKLDSLKDKLRGAKK